MRLKIGFAALVMTVSLLVASNAKADLVSYVDGAAAQDAGLVELYSVTVTGTTRNPVVGAADVPVFLSDLGRSGESREDRRNFLGIGAVTWHWWNLWSYNLDTEALAGYDSAVGYATTNVSYSGNDFVNGYVNVTATGGTFELYTWNTDNYIFGGQTSQTFGQSDFSFTVTYYGYAPSGNDVPEPATLALMGLGLAGLGLARRRMK